MVLAHASSSAPNCLPALAASHFAAANVKSNNGNLGQCDAMAAAQRLKRRMTLRGPSGNAPASELTSKSILGHWPPTPLREIGQRMSHSSCSGRRETRIRRHRRAPADGRRRRENRCCDFSQGHSLSSSSSVLAGGPAWPPTLTCRERTGNRRLPPERALFWRRVKISLRP